MSTTFDQPGNAPDAQPGPAGTYDQSFSTSGRARLHLDNPRGQVRVTGWDRPEVHVRAVKRRDASSARYEATQVVLTQDGDTVVARTVLDPSATLAARGMLSGAAAEIVRAFADLLPNNALTAPVDYDVQVPTDSELDLHAVSANVAVQGTRGAYKVRTVSGEIDIKDVQGDADIGSVSGDVEATGLNGRVHVEEVSGNALLAGNVPTLHAKSVSGDVELSGPLSANGSYELKSVSGAVTMRVPATTGASISLRGVSPDIQSDLPGTVTRNTRGPGHREWEGKVGNGGATVRFHTVSGNLYLRRLSEAEAPRANDNPQVSAEPAIAAAPPELEIPSAEAPSANQSSDSGAADPGEGAELRILNALERGELSVEDALKQLDALRAGQ